MVNLVGNAIKFTDEGEVVLEVRRASQSDGDVQLQFTVMDTGIGIPAEKQNVIFEAFEQADRSTTRRFGGSGLGLTISSRLVECMGGRIWMDSDAASGSTFHFTARFALTDALATDVPVEQPTVLRDVRVLVVDDKNPVAEHD